MSLPETYIFWWLILAYGIAMFAIGWTLRGWR
jgi:hypothetical protein